MTFVLFNPNELNKIYHCDCMDLLVQMPDKFVQLSFTSPPYNMRTRIRNGQYTTRETSKHFSKKYEFFDDAMPIEDYYSFHKEVISQLLRISNIACYNFQIVTGSKEAYFKLIGDYSKQIKDIIIWDKGSGQPAMHENILNSCYELILVMEDDNKCGRMIQNATFERGTMNNILRINKNRNSTNKSHSAAFPIELPTQLIKAFSNPNDIIFDPFIGTGTTALAARKLNRRYIGCELVEEYFDISNNRLVSNDNIDDLFE